MKLFIFNFQHRKSVFITRHGGNSQTGCSRNLSVAMWIDVFGWRGDMQIQSRKSVKSFTIESLCQTAFKWQEV